MYPFLPLGPLSIPTAPLFAILAGWFGISMMARAGRRQGLNPDLVSNAGFIALASGLIVARLWHVVQFWAIYLEEPLLALSLRPGGMSPGAGIVAALVGGYAYLIYARLDPAKVTAALALGLMVGDGLWQIGAYLTGAVVGLPSSLPWAFAYFGETLHPAALYRALGAFGVTAAIYTWADFRRPGRLILLSLLGYGLVRLISDAFVDGAALLGTLRVSQVTAFALALAAAWLLSRRMKPTTTPAE
ncbi:MAG: prolipoprotein diacylglyceryl transferase [Caldilineaceae bacterium]